MNHGQLNSLRLAKADVERAAQSLQAEISGRGDQVQADAVPAHSSQAALDDLNRVAASIGALIVKWEAMP